MKHNIPIPFYFDADTTDGAIQKYKAQIPSILDELSMTGKDYMVLHFGITYNPETKLHRVYITIKEDELVAERKQMMSMAAKAMNMIGGDPSCEHEYENTPQGLICSKCGGQLS